MKKRRLTKNQLRRLRKRKKDLKGKKRALSEKSQKPWEPPKMKLFEIPQIFPKGLSKQQREDIVREIGKKAKEAFNQKFPMLEKWFKEYDTTYILSFCAFYFVSSPEGIDREANGSLEFYPHYLEILQAFALMQDRNYSPKPLLNEQNIFMDELKEVGQATQMRWLDMPEKIESEEDFHKYSLRQEIMSNTAAVRNWAYF